MSNNGSKQIFMLGIAGSGMRGLAHLLASQGHTIVGTDDSLSSSAIDHELSSICTILMPNESIDAISASDLLIHTDAAPMTHPLRQKAQEAGIKQAPYHEALGDFSRSYTTIAVTGSHGKSSTTAFLAHILSTCGVDPTVLIGAPIKGWEYGNARVEKSNLFVVEADEYRRHFLELSPSYVIVTSVDFDHPDYFTSLADVEDAYSEFISKLEPPAIVFTRDSVIQEHPEIDWSDTVISIKKANLENVPAPIPGRHMQSNAALAIEAAIHIANISRKDAINALLSFPGLGRRLELLGTWRNIPVYSDYAHHPTEIAATLTAVKETHKDKRITVVFEAHMFERLTTFFDEFVTSLQLANTILIYPPFSPSGREVDTNQQQLIQHLASKLEELRKSVKIIESSPSLFDDMGKVVPETDIFLATTAGKLDSALRDGMKS